MRRPCRSWDDVGCWAQTSLRSVTSRLGRCISCFTQPPEDELADTPLASDLTGATLLSDSELVLQARQGDRRSFGTLYLRHHDAAWRVACAAAGSATDAEDAVAEGFAKVFAALPRMVDRELAFRPYLLACVRNAAVDRHRRTRKIDLRDEVPERAAAVGEPRRDRARRPGAQSRRRGPAVAAGALADGAVADRGQRHDADRGQRGHRHQAQRGGRTLLPGPRGAAGGLPAGPRPDRGQGRLPLHGRPAQRLRPQRAVGPGPGKGPDPPRRGVPPAASGATSWPTSTPASSARGCPCPCCWAPGRSRNGSPSLTSGKGTRRAKVPAKAAKTAQLGTSPAVQAHPGRWWSPCSWPSPEAWRSSASAPAARSGKTFDPVALPKRADAGPTAGRTDTRVAAGPDRGGPARPGDPDAPAPPTRRAAEVPVELRRHRSSTPRAGARTAAPAARDRLPAPAPEPAPEPAAGPRSRRR